MSGRFVRASKFRHVFGDPSKQLFMNVNPACMGEGNFIAANATFIAFATTGGGGPVNVMVRSEPARLAVNAPTVNVHTAKVLDVAFSPFNDNLLATTCDDGTAKLSMLPSPDVWSQQTTHITEAVQSFNGHQKKVSIVQFNPAANNILATVSYDHTVKLWDAETGQCAYNADFTDVVHSVAWNNEGSLLAALCKDKSVYMFDPRARAAGEKMGDALTGTKPGRVVFMEKTNHLAVIGHDVRSNRQILTYDLNKLGKPQFVTDLDQSAGSIIAHYDFDTGVMFLAGKGDASIRYYEVVEDGPYFLSEFRSNLPQKGACFLPKRACDVTKCEIACAMRVQKNVIEPISFMVPRKSDMFQEDLFPDSFLQVPGVQAPEWLEGKSAAPPVASMKPGAAASTGASSSAAAPVRKPAPTAAELKAQLDRANARIAELEAEVARLKAH